MTKLDDTRQQDWQPLRPELTSGVFSKLLLDGSTRMALIRVEPGGLFQPHRDHYGHLFHIISGEGHFVVEGDEYILSAGMTLQIQAEGLHGYENHGSEDLLLVSANLPVE